MQHSWRISSVRRNSLPIPLTPLGQPIREHWWKLQQISGERRCWLWPCVLSSIPSSQRELEKNTEGLEVNREQWYLTAIRPQTAISSLNNVDATGMSVSMKLLETTDSIKRYRHIQLHKGKKASQSDQSDMSFTSTTLSLSRVWATWYIFMSHSCLLS